MDYFDTEIPRDMIKQHQKRSFQLTLFVLFFSCISLILSIIGIVLNEQKVFYIALFSLADSIIGIFISLFGYYTCKKCTLGQVRLYKILCILYSLLYLISKLSSGILDILNNPGNLLVIIFFSILYFFSLPLCFYYAASTSFFARKLEKVQKDPLFAGSSHTTFLQN